MARLFFPYNMASSDDKYIKPKPGLNPDAPIFVPRPRPVIIEESGHQIQQNPEIAPHQFLSNIILYQQQQQPQFQHCNNLPYFPDNYAITRLPLFQESHYQFSEFPQNLNVHRNNANNFYNNSNINNDPNNRLHPSNFEDIRTLNKRHHQPQDNCYEENYNNSEYEDNLRYRRPHHLYKTRNYQSNSRDNNNRSGYNKDKFGKWNNSGCNSRTSPEIKRDFNTKTYSQKEEINLSNREEEDEQENSDISHNNLNLSTTISSTPDRESRFSVPSEELNKSKTISKDLLEENFVSITEITPNKEEENANSLTTVNSLIDQFPKKLDTFESPNITKYNKLVDPRIEREKLRNIDRALEDLVGKEYDEWEKNYKEINTEIDDELTVITEVYGDLFDQPKEYSLAHCVAEDLKMGMGIATSFKREFQNLNTLQDQKAKQGGVAILNDEENKRFLYYLVTKRESIGKPTYLSLFKSLYNMRKHIKENKVKKLAIPRLGCGLDRLEWRLVKSMIKFIFKKIELQIVICNFHPNWKS